MPHANPLSHLQVPVPLLKEKIATVTGILSEQQRLICRGRVLKDDELLSAYRILLYLTFPFFILFFLIFSLWDLFTPSTENVLCIWLLNDVKHIKYCHTSENCLCRGLICYHFAGKTVYFFRCPVFFHSVDLVSKIPSNPNVML